MVFSTAEVLYDHQVDEFRIIQEDFDYIRVLLKTHEAIFPKNGHDLIVRGIKKRMGQPVRVEVENMEAIPRNASGKYRYVVSKVADKSRFER